MDRKYHLIKKDPRHFHGTIVYRIQADRDFGDVKRGDKGGFVESENNLSHYDDCWIYGASVVVDNAVVKNNARVFNAAIIEGQATIQNNAQVYEQAIIQGNVIIRDNAEIYGNAYISDNVMVCDEAQVFGNAHIYNDAVIFGKAFVYDDATVRDNASIYGCAQVFGNANIINNSRISGNACVYGYSQVKNDSIVEGYANICQEMTISSGSVTSDLIFNLKENIRCQTGLGVFNNKVIAYKQVNRDMTSFFDKKFKYEVGEIIEVEGAEISNEPCASGLHFSNMNYWNHAVGDNTLYLMAEIDLKDIITVQRGKIRCKKAKILGVYNPQEK